MSGIAKTKAMLAESMKQLMQKMPLEKISVGDIIEHAQIGRNTFYYHFQDKYDLVIWVFQTETAALLSADPAASDWCETVDRLVDYLCQNREFYCNALAYDGQNSLQEHLYQLFKARAKQQILARQTESGAALRPQDPDLGAAFFASALQGQLVRWVKRGMHPSPASYRESVARVLQCAGLAIPKTTV